jgi:hypothetical protein
LEPLDRALPQSGRVTAFDAFQANAKDGRASALGLLRSER